MPQINIEVNVYCAQPNWVFEKDYIKPAYRIYANHDLLTERAWLWGKNPLTENIWLDGEAKEYSIKLVPILKNPAQAKFRLADLIITNFVASDYKITKASAYDITFALLNTQ
jgi:hypothetical protein